MSLETEFFMNIYRLIFGFVSLCSSAFAIEVKDSIEFTAPKDEVFRAMDNGDFSKKDYEKLKKGSAEDYFSKMDKGITLPKGSLQENGKPFSENQDILHEKMSEFIPGISKEEAVERAVRGRNNWMVYTGGNDQFWDFFNGAAFGGIDFLKTLSNHPEASTIRSKRWQKLGLVNEPCFRESKGPRADRYGLWLDVRDPNCAPDPFENEEKYPGVKIGSRGKDLYVGVGVPASFADQIGGPERELRTYLSKKHAGKEQKHPVGSSYGYATGILGLRIFPNPDFDVRAAALWDPKRYYEDPSYFKDPGLVKPYRVGMACAFCHVGPSPINPPKNFNAPKWENLSSSVGSQYFWVDRVFFWNYRKEQGSLVHQLLHSARPGTLDTSLISSDQINNPRTMNAVYGLGARLKAAKNFSHTERIRGKQRNNKQFKSFVSKKSPLHSYSTKTKRERKPGYSMGVATNYVTSPRILKDGSDSVGALGGLNRVYINIGLYSEEWVRNFVPLLGTTGIPFFKITPFRIDVAEKKSGYWNANTEQTPDLTLFFLASATKDALKDAPGGKAYLKDYLSPEVERGKEVFAQNCASCHSSKLPVEAQSFFEDKSCIGKGYLKCWEKYWNHANTNKAFKEELLKIVKSEDFLEDNYLSTDLRVPIDIVGTQTCTAVATNAIVGDIWDNFSSDSYKSLPQVKKVGIYKPSKKGISYNKEEVSLPAGGRGYLRPPSLISVWSTAPFFNNNSLGPFKYKGDLKSRMESFNTSIDWLLNPERRGTTYKRDSLEKLVEYEQNGFKAKGIVDVFAEDTYISLPAAYIPAIIYNSLPDDWKQSYPDGHRLNRKKIQFRKRYSTQAQKKTGFFNKIASWFRGSSQKRDVASYEYGDDYTGDSADYVLDDSVEENRIYFGPIPKGVPINLISNMNLESSKLDLISAVLTLKKAVDKVKNIKGRDSKAEARRARVFMGIASEALLKVSKCQDFIVNKGHYFGTKFQVKGQRGLKSEDKRALAEFIKHM